MHDVPERTVIACERAVIGIDAEALGYRDHHHADIAANWADATLANPALFNGAFFMAEHAELADGIFRARYHRADFATMMHWKRHDTTEKPWHVFAVGVIVSSDNKLIAGRMSASTSAAGRIYFPAGSFDDEDVVDHRIDIDGNMHREVMEETGLDLARASRRDNGLHLVSANRSIALFRRFFFDLPANRIISDICDHIASEAVPELDGVVAVSTAGQLDESTPEIFHIFTRWHFGDASPS
jgi:8-oxo-dGTP pyrophosphatase MutT (NUDIX family)